MSSLTATFVNDTMRSPPFLDSRIDLMRTQWLLFHAIIGAPFSHWDYKESRT